MPMIKKLGGVADAPEGCAVIQQDLDRLERQALTTFLGILCFSFCSWYIVHYDYKCSMSSDLFDGDFHKILSKNCLFKWKCKDHCISNLVALVMRTRDSRRKLKQERYRHNILCTFSSRCMFLNVLFHSHLPKSFCR